VKPRRLAAIALGLVAVDLLAIVVSGGRSLLALGASVGPWGFGARALAAAIALVLYGRTLAPAEDRIEWGRLVLVVALLPTLAQFQYAGGRINGDGIMYYVYVRSLWKDFDLDLTNEYTHYELIRRSDLAVPTKTGLRRSIFSIGPAVVATPFFWLGEAGARLEQLAGGSPDLSGYGPYHRNAVALGSLLYGFAAVLLVHDLLRRHFGPGTALGTALLLWFATFLHWYMVQQPTMSHAPSAFAAALVVWLWARRRGDTSLWTAFVLGLAIGIAMCVRWQNGVLLILPGLDLLPGLTLRVEALAARAARGFALVAGAVIGAIPQMVAWKALYDEWVLRYPPHGADFLRLDHPYWLQTFFSSRHGLFSWTPVFWAAYLGFVPLVARRRAVALPLLPPLVLMTYVNVCSGDWWAGGSFSNRRFDSLLPILAFGLAAAIDLARRVVARHPQVAIALVLAPPTLWNLTLAAQVRRGLVPRDEAVAFPSLVGGAARVFADAFGSPNTWPASWIFAWREGRPPGQYDLLVGRYLFYRQNNMNGHVEIGVPGDEAMLGEGWGRIESYVGAGCRAIRGGRAALFAPLDVPEALEVRFRAAARGASPAEVRVSVNGKEAGRFQAGPEWADHHVRVEAGFWKRELNQVGLEVVAGDVVVDAVDFARVGGAFQTR
jgi:hypothetical protein